MSTGEKIARALSEMMAAYSGPWDQRALRRVTEATTELAKLIDDILKETSKP